jgi:vacuolar protein sorting-associated protein 13A/C
MKIQLAQTNNKDFLKKQLRNSSSLAIISNPADQDVDSKVSLIDSNSQKLHLEMKISDVSHTVGGAKKVSIYSSYVVINKRGLPLEIMAQSLAVFRRTNLGEMTSPKEYSNFGEVTPLMLSFSGSETLRNRVSIKSYNTDWSRPFSLDAVGNVSEIPMRVLPEEDSLHAVIGLSITSGTGKVNLTQIGNLSCFSVSFYEIDNFYTKIYGNEQYEFNFAISRV